MSKNKVIITCIIITIIFVLVYTSTPMQKMFLNNRIVECIEDDKNISQADWKLVQKYYKQPFIVSNEVNGMTIKYKINPKDGSIIIDGIDK